VSNGWVKNTSLEALKEKNTIIYYAKQFDLHPLVMKIIFDKGYKDWWSVNRFLGSDPSFLTGPYYLRDMDKAVERINFAIERDEKIAIFGDYDTDGVTSTSILYKALRILKADVMFYLPKRSEGYGLSIKAVNEFAEKGISLIVTVDNGSSTHEEIKRAKELGIDVVVTDHHEILKGNPTCCAFVNPKRSDERFPYPYLAGAGVALKLVHALFRGRGLWDKHIWDFIDLAAIGTVGDIMPLKEENRVIVQLGIEAMNMYPSRALKILFKLLRIDKVTSTTIAFSIVPVFNSAGRLSDPNFVVHILTSEASDEVIEECWRKLIRLNNLRKDLVHKQFMHADLLINLNELDKQKVIVVAGDFHEGLIGLLASRISEKYKKPSIVLTSEGKGSARSVSGSSFSIVNCIERCAEFLKSYGGHQAAAGLTVYADRFKHFQKEIQKAAKDQPINFMKHVYEDEVSILDFPQELHDSLKYLEPFGEGNRSPMFHSKKMVVDQIKHFGNQEQHVKFKVGHKEALLFFKGDQFKPLNEKSHLQCLYYPQTNSYNQFMIHDYCDP
jgi:single-stranded-DNA-specific exonuclease